MNLRRIITDPPNNYYSKLAQVESGNNPLAKAKTSTASGLYQFTEGTWNQLTDDLGLNYSLEDRFNPTKSRKVVEEFTKRNERSLKKRLGREPNEAELYLAHFSGAGGAGKILDTVSSNPNSLVTDFVSKGALRANKSIFFNKDGSPKKAYEIYNWSAKKFDTPEMEAPLEEAPLEEVAEKKATSKYISEEALEAMKKAKDNTAVAPSEEQVREVLAQEQESTQQKFLNAFQQQGSDQVADYQPQQQDLSHLYNYINLQD